MTWFTWNTNHHLCGPQASFRSPEGEEALRPPWSDLRSPGRISRIGEYPCAAAAESLQSCPTPCDPIDGSPPGSSVPGILQARTLEWVAISFSNA